MEQINVALTHSAYADLEDIENYISLDSPYIARQFINRIFDKMDVLYQHPLAGKPVPEFGDKSIRELLLNKYRIIYLVVDDTHINVIRIVHGSRLLDIEF